MTDLLPGVPPGDPRPPALCRLCGRRLTTALARQWQLGEGCRAKLHIREAPIPRTGDVRQDALPGL
ncbi:DUF6011 domain-containing protein [Streptomyces bohaiensis]|uniref:ComF family protein n=1 Tax=Streptomyces bohaiensis TaxID=1431344 RepID=A0ABX1CBL4_9ACTN|nr:DUF6011 domain-containing protein [Streptomyces bohaiensis]NJQ15528.1 hypothetical protein [Streptomyces bohaiensis]